MNQARSTYQSDYSSLDWFQNNFNSDISEFCSSENIDECLKYISQEFSALGYPSIYSTSSECPFAVNCDIVKLLNAIFELLKTCNEQAQTKEELEDRNTLLSADLNVLYTKNTQIKTSVEQLERKLASALERERQLKEKSEQLTQLLKIEKEETKKLSGQMRQQKIAFQHEIRKHENNLNHIKAKLNQLLSDKTSNKKIASINISQPLPRSTGQRSKWKTSSTASSAIEDMYTSIIGNYETRSKDAYKEILLLRQYLQSVLLQTLDVVTLLKGGEDNSVFSSISEEFILSIMNNECRDVSSFDERFTFLFSALKNLVSKQDAVSDTSLVKEVAFLKSKISEYEALFGMLKESHNEKEIFKNVCFTNTFNEDLKKMFEEEKKKIAEEKISVARSLEILEKEKAEVATQKLAVLKFAMQQKMSSSGWHQGLVTSPSLSIITSQDSSIKIPDFNQLKLSASSPDHIGLSTKSGDCSQTASNTFLSLKLDSFQVPNSSVNQVSLGVPAEDIEFSTSDLPSWATSITTDTDDVFFHTKTLLSETSQNVSAQEFELTPDPSSQDNMECLQAAMLDLKRRKDNLS